MPPRPMSSSSRPLRPDGQGEWPWPLPAGRVPGSFIPSPIRSEVQPLAPALVTVPKCHESVGDLVFPASGCSKFFTPDPAAPGAGAVEASEPPPLGSALANLWFSLPLCSFLFSCFTVPGSSLNREVLDLSEVCSCPPSFSLGPAPLLSLTVSGYLWLPYFYLQWTHISG